MTTKAERRASRDKNINTALDYLNKAKWYMNRTAMAMLDETGEHLCALGFADRIQEIESDIRRSWDD